MCDPSSSHPLQSHTFRVLSFHAMFFVQTSVRLVYTVQSDCYKGLHSRCDANFIFWRLSTTIQLSLSQKSQFLSEIKKKKLSCIQSFFCVFTKIFIAIFFQVLLCFPSCTILLIPFFENEYWQKLLILVTNENNFASCPFGNFLLASWHQLSKVVYHKIEWSF